MKNYIVSIDIAASKVKPEIITSIENIIIKRMEDNSIFASLESVLDKSASLESHISDILLNPYLGEMRNLIPYADKFYLNIGVFYDTATCTVILPNEVIVKLLSEFPQIYLKTVCYPCEES